MKMLSRFTLIVLILCAVLKADTVYSQQEPKKMKKLERIAASQIDESELKSLPTNELLERCLNFPYLFDILLIEDIPLIFPHMVKAFNGFQEFFDNRSDAGSVLLDRIKMTDIAGIGAKDSEHDKCLYAFRLCYLTFFLTQNNIMRQLSGDEKEVLNELLKKLDDINAFEQTVSAEYYGGISYNFIGYALMKYIDTLDPDIITELKSDNTNIAAASEKFHCTAFNPESINLIVQKANYLIK